MPITNARNHNGTTVTVSKETAIDFNQDGLGHSPLGYCFSCETNNVTVFINGVDEIELFAGEPPHPYWALRGSGITLVEVQASGGNAEFWARSMGM